MISPESYYECLKGQPCEEILREIRRLKRSFSKLKRDEERQRFDGEIILMDPCVELQIEYIREYLFGAIKAYEEAGGIYKRTRNEIKARDFQENIPFISEIKFTHGGFFEGWITYTFTFDEYAVFCKVKDFRHNVTTKFENPIDGASKQALFEKLEKLYLGEWLTDYSPRRFGCGMYDDGYEWDIEIHYSNGKKPFRSGGCNDEPYNFDELLEVLGIDLDDEEEEEE